MLWATGRARCDRRPAMGPAITYRLRTRLPIPESHPEAASGSETIDATTPRRMSWPARTRTDPAWTEAEASEQSQ
jgi:hypothetical protein